MHNIIIRVKLVLLLGYRCEVILVQPAVPALSTVPHYTRRCTWRKKNVFVEGEGTYYTLNMFPANWTKVYYMQDILSSQTLPKTFYMCVTVCDNTFHGIPPRCCETHIHIAFILYD